MLINSNMLMLQNIFLTKIGKKTFDIYEKKTLFAIQKKFFSKLFFSQYCTLKNDR